MNYFYKIRIVVLFFVTCAVFFLNCGVAQKTFFENFQLDSESLVVGKILAEKFHIPSNANLEVCSYLGNLPNRSTQIMLLDAQDFDSTQLVFTGYFSQYGLQGAFFSQFCSVGSAVLMLGHLASACLLAYVTLHIFISYKKNSKLFALSFLLSVLFSPWLVSFARNLFWVPFTWFLPALFSLLILKNLNSNKRFIYFALLFMSFFVKCLCGYEYISSIILFSGLPIVYHYLFIAEDRQKKRIIKFFFAVMITGVFAFIAALLLHAKLRAGVGTVVDGLNIIYSQDVLRRTYGSSANFPSVYAESLQASLLTVLKLYFFEWKTPVLAFMSVQLGYSILFFLSVLLLIGQILCRMLSLRYLVLYIYSLAIPCSWFVLAKSHSFLHAHMNYVLWYFGFVQVCIFIIFLSIANCFSKFNMKKLVKQC